MTRKSKLRLKKQATESAEFVAIDKYASGINGIHRYDSSVKSDARFSFPAEFVSFTSNMYVTFKAPVPADAVTRLTELKPGQWVTATSDMVRRHLSRSLLFEATTIRRPQNLKPGKVVLRARRGTTFTELNYGVCGYGRKLPNKNNPSNDWVVFRKRSVCDTYRPGRSHHHSK